MKKKHGNLVKQLVLRDGPNGLYPDPIFWMEGKDMEGFNAHFSFQYVKKTGTCHPVEGMLVHPYDECLVFASLNREDMLDLGGEVSISGGLITRELLPDEILAFQQTADLTLSEACGLSEQEQIKKALSETGHNVSEAARKLGISRSTLYRKMKKYQ